jgi:predicted AAA+ superfamily ATPase
MSENLISRHIEPLLFDTLSDTPVAVLQGARQVGKSTLVAMVSSSLDCRQLTFDDPDILLAARDDPVDFVNQYEKGTLIVDEVQLFPELLRVIKLSVDQKRRPGRFLLTGSADLLHVSGANESLAGRAETVRLFPFSCGEIAGFKEDFIAALARGGIADTLRSAKPISREDYAELVVRGGFPDAVSRKKNRRDAYFRNYLSGVMDHDAVSISNLTHIDRLPTLFAVLSGNTSGVFVQSGVSRQVGIPETSMGGYIKLLKDLHLIHVLPAWGRNIAKRAVSKPKISIMDTGIACCLNDAHSEFLTDVTGGEVFGPVLESFAVNELFKQQTWSSARFRLYHYLDRERREVDVLAELANGRIIALEVKAARSISRKDFLGMNYLRELLGERFLCGIVLYTGSDVQQYGDRVYSAPLCSIWSV